MSKKVEALGWLVNKLKSSKVDKDKVAELLDNDLNANYGIIDYTRGQSTRINRMLRNDEEPTMDAYNQLQKVFQKEGNFFGETYRGTLLDTDKVSKLKEGDIIKNKAVLSTSHDPSIAETFSLKSQGKGTNTNIKFNIKDTPQYNIEKYSEFPDEKEVLIKPGTYSKVVRKKDSGDNVQLELNTLSDLDVSKLSKTEYNNIFKTLMGVGGISTIPKQNKEEENE